MFVVAAIGLAALVLRGADLSELFRFDTEAVNALFPIDRRAGS